MAAPQASAAVPLELSCGTFCSVGRTAAGLLFGRVSIASERTMEKALELSRLETWLTEQATRSIAALQQAISATHLCRRRERFGQIITPAPGSVLASPVIADWNPEPDYFFHWLRDSAIVMRSVAELLDDAAGEDERRHWRRYFDDFVRFSLNLTKRGDQKPQRVSVRDDADSRFLRPAREIRELTGDALLAEPRFNPDGSIDIFRWSRPQYDGPALRAVACLRYLAAGGPLTDALARLLRIDLDFTVRHAGEPCIGPWEEPEQNGFHYYVELVQLGALSHGGAWTGRDAGARNAWRAAEQKLRDDLDLYWSDRHQVLMAMRPPSADAADDLLDAATLLAVWDADLPDGPHSVGDARVQKTLGAIESLFARELPINRGRTRGPLLGRSRRDRYFGGGAWYPTTLAAAGLCYRLAQRSPHDRAALIERGDAFMASLREFTPADGSLSEQIDRATGRQSSARRLTWSYAAFVSAARERRRALAPPS
jgi:glucoamylase